MEAVMKRITTLLLTGLLIFVLVQSIKAQEGTNNVHLFQTYFFDAPIAKAGYGEGGIIFLDYEKWNTFGIGVQGGYPINEKIELQTALRFINWSPDKGDGKSGISDLDVYGRYNFYNQKQTNISVGGMITLPIGSDDVGQGNLNFGAFGALRHSLQNNIVLVGTLGLFFMEGVDDDYDSNLLFGGGTIYKVNEQLNIVGELNIWSKNDYMMLSGGVDYLLGNGRLRGALGIGLDDGAPDITLIGSYSISLSK
jgi:hypothetical protein